MTRSTGTIGCPRSTRWRVPRCSTSPTRRRRPSRTRIIHRAAGPSVQRANPRHGDFAPVGATDHGSRRA
jgi:hypothetical protein